MQARKAATIIVAATCAGLAIGGAILLVGLQFHRSSHAGDHERGRPAFVKELPESYLEAWADPVALATVGLVIVTGMLAIFTYLLYRSAAETARDAKEASAAALKASTEATKLAREEFNATHRPEIVVHNFEATRDHTHDDEEEAIGAGFTVVNRGTADALIEKVEGIIVPGVHYLRPGIALGDLNIAPHTLASGQHRENVAIFGKVTAEMQFESGFGADPTIKLWCIGRINYSDQAGRKRQTGFCRSYDIKRHLWVKEPASDYEYSY